MKTEKETKQDELAAIGIGAMIVFIALILGCGSSGSGHHSDRRKAATERTSQR